ncbi:MAG: ATP-dependent DNA ligase, partial [Chitinophagaceae bacterium]|nr:ATP-dependent DNA ligase [Chitinophagaceae bacterium]
MEQINTNSIIPNIQKANFTHFAALVYTLGTTTKTNEKLAALQDYFTNASNEDKLWVIAIFSGRRPKRAVTATQLKEWCIELTGLTQWLFEECYHTVGDLAETIALLTENIQEKEFQLNDWSLSEYILQLIDLQKKDDAVKKAFILHCWQNMQQQEKFVFNKLITGGFRIGVSQKLMINALAKTLQIEESLVAHKISGNWNPATIQFQDLMNSNTIDYSKPYPFYLAYAIDKPIEDLGNEHDWQAEWKWDGIRGQIIKRNNELFVWSRGEELMTDKFPEYTILQELLPNGIALDGEIIPMQNNQPLPFALMQTRIGRKNIT